VLSRERLEEAARWRSNSITQYADHLGSIQWPLQGRSFHRAVDALFRTQITRCVRRISIFEKVESRLIGRSTVLPLPNRIDLAKLTYALSACLLLRLLACPFPPLVPVSSEVTPHARSSAWLIYADIEAEEVC